jgi:hypothetical protein
MKTNQRKITKEEGSERRIKEEGSGRGRTTERGGDGGSSLRLISLLYMQLYCERANSKGREYNPASKQGGRGNTPLTTREGEGDRGEKELTTGGGLEKG